MLVLTRRIGEKLVFTYGDVRIEVSVLKARHAEVRIGIDAPRTVEIIRSEIETKSEKPR